MPAVTAFRPSVKIDLGQHGGRRGAVAGDIGGVRGHFAHHLRAHVLEGIFHLISLATDTPSLLTAGAPKAFCITTFRPRGPSVAFTARASTRAPSPMR